MNSPEEHLVKEVMSCQAHGVQAPFHANFGEAQGIHLFTNGSPDVSIQYIFLVVTATISPSTQKPRICSTTRAILQLILDLQDLDQSLYLDR